MAATKLPLTTWFLAIYLLSQAKTGLAALALMRNLGVSYRLIPANGWYEWRRTESGKQPYYLTLKDGDPDDVVFFAGLGEPAGEGRETCCAILPAPVSQAFELIHDRQPVVLDPECR